MRELVRLLVGSSETLRLRGCVVRFVTGGVSSASVRPLYDCEHGEREARTRGGGDAEVRALGGKANRS